MSVVTRCIALLALIAMVTLPILAASDEVKQVNPKHICFMTGKRFDRGLKSVTVSGKTYYGCCGDCLAQLQDDPKARQAVDPVSGKTIDKADALIGVDKNGKIYFFEDRQNLKKFRAPTEIPTGN